MGGEMMRFLVRGLYGDVICKALMGNSPGLGLELEGFLPFIERKIWILDFMDFFVA
jgi:hypothetical protein